jgi:hydrogenase maturation protein HypF
MTGTAAASAARRRVRAHVAGTVQGVGFRPFVYRLAADLGLGGWVLNDGRGVVIEVEGSPEAVDELLVRLREQAPPLAAIEAVRVESAAPTGERGFRILESERGGPPEALVSPDFATCAECLAEVFDPADRRHRYPFTNCTNCGPRFSIVRGVPYDRPLTTMAGFEMCERCRAEYEDPLDRRFHAQPNACPDCGPRARLVGADGAELGGTPGGDAVEAAAALLRSGSVLAVKGIGGYHLACLAVDERAVATLRARKRREARPLALMAADLEAARPLVELTATEEELLADRARPIVVARRRAGAEIAPSVAPGCPDLGLMLAYSPLHHLLLADVGAPLVMTSGNVSDEPMAYVDDDARERLGRIADAFLVHDRPICVRTDDSVLRAVGPDLRPAPLMLRRSRGHVPASISLPLVARRPMLGCGAELKSTFCLARGDRAWVGHHIGDLRNWDTLSSFRDGVAHFERLFGVEPQVVAHDLHPDYLSTGYALEREGVQLVAVQHHHAHLAACLAEHGEPGPAVGAIFDGSGYGPDGTVWGGELLVGDLRGYERAGFLFPVRLPGGDAAAQEPWRMACAWLAAAFDTQRPPPPARLALRIERRSWDGVCELVNTGLRSPLTTSAGRLFDAVAALCGLNARVTYEGQAATELESAASVGAGEDYEMDVIDAGGEGPVIVDPRATVRAISADLDTGAEPAAIGARFHAALAAATAEACALVARRRGIDLAVLSGGVFQNRLLVERTAELLTSAGLRVLVPQLLPPNDGGISYGQVAVACAQEARG